MSENNNIIMVSKSRDNILDILEARKFNTENYKGFSVNEIHSLLTNDQLDMMVNSDTKKIYIKYFNLEKSLRPNNVHEIVDSLFHIEQVLTPNDELIIITKDEPNETLQKLQRSLFEHDKVYVNIICIQRLQFNILKHALVPPHRVISEEEKQQVKTKYNIEKDREFPSISRFDPVSQVLGIRPGEVFEIERSSKTAIKRNFYRICST